MSDRIVGEAASLEVADCLVGRRIRVGPFSYSPSRFVPSLGLFIDVFFGTVVLSLFLFYFAGLSER